MSSKRKRSYSSSDSDSSDSSLSSDSSSDSEDERKDRHHDEKDRKKEKHKHKKHKKGKKKEKKHKKKDKKKEKKDKKKEKKSKKEKEKTNSNGSKSSTISTSKSIDFLDPSSRPKLSSSDYWSKGGEFARFLSEILNKKLNDLTKIEAHQLFEEVFIPKWNSNQLPPHLYQPITLAELDPKLRTSHRWNIKTDQTDNSKQEKKRPLDNDENQSILDKEETHKKQKKSDKEYVKKKKEVMEELYPKATGRDAMVEKKKQITSYHRQENSSREDVELSDSQIYGSVDIHAKSSPLHSLYSIFISLTFITPHNLINQHPILWFLRLLIFSHHIFEPLRPMSVMMVFDLNLRTVREMCE